MKATATISSKNQITVPAEVRKRLGLGAGDKVSFEFDDGGVRLSPAKRLTVAELFGSFPPLAGASADLKEEIDEGMSEEADRIEAAMSRP
jgi:antitoxin PrlF